MAERTSHDVEQSYRSRRDRFAAERTEATRASSRVGRTRLMLFVAGAAAVFAGGDAVGPRRTIWFAVAAVIAMVFLVLARRHREIKRRLRRCAVLVELNELGLYRLARRWDFLPSPPGSGLEDHAYAPDLDLYGKASLRALLGVVSPAPGEPTLRAWLLAGAKIDVVRRRQEAVSELAPLIDVREALAANVRLGAVRQASDLERFLAWVDADGWLAHRPAMVWLARALTAATVGLLVWWAQAPDRPAYWLAAVSMNLALLGTVVRQARRTFADASLGADMLGGYAGSFHLIATRAHTSRMLREKAEELGGASDGAATSVRRLARLVEIAEVRYSPMLHFLVNALVLLDIHTLAAVEAWREHARPRTRGWFAALGEVEAVAALATLAHDHPDWSFPELVDSGAARLEASALGHPLIADDGRVANDVELGPPGTFLFVTGSNMSGKSTLLRAIGTNVVLAQAGGPVCATRMTLAPVELRTSMRVQDSLEHGVSLFMAELQRLRTVVEAAREARQRGSSPVLFLLDEILHGTNTAERQIAARRIIAHLFEEGAIGAVSTHDLSLAETEELARAARPVHFTEHFEPGGNGTAPRMTFDYTLRQGIATSRNALRLVEMMGLG
jgi:hypothetical protein